MVQNIMMAATSLQNVDEINRWDNRPFTGRLAESRYNNSTDVKRTIKKKPKRIRTAYTTVQLQTLESIFTQTKYINLEYRREIALKFNLTDKNIKIWFQNRRMKAKRESSESSSDSSNETTISEMSPPPLPQTELQNPVQVNVNQDENNLQAPASGSCQFQIPNYYMNYGTEELIQTTNAPGTMPAYGMQFYNDGNINMFPTQHYPYNDNNYYNNFNANYQYLQEHAIGNNCLDSNMTESSYFYN